MKLLKLFLLALPIIVFTGCNTDDEEFPLSELAGTYVGGMNVSSSSFQNAQYTVTVSLVGSNSVRITPSTGAATEWTATMTKIAGVYTCLGCITNNQITFTSVSNGIELAYNYENDEQFAGYKQ